ncbi:hypothetical protein G9A89_002453 [Geosiphon pyriformis]|nr:hypothetical protein G9A89_002453 [Geosiphon pyriformis]
MQQLNQNVNRPVQIVIVTADEMKKTPVKKIDNFLFTINRIIIPVKVLVINTPQYQTFIGNDWLLKANTNLDWETLKLKISYQGQYTIVSATCDTFNKQSEKAPVFKFEKKKEMPFTETYMAIESTSNWAEETEQKNFEESREWKKVRYSTPEPQKKPPYIPLKCKNCKKKLSPMEACISPEEEYETHICYFCKACYRERFGSPKKRTPFDAAYNSILNKLYYYPHDTKIIFDLAMALINGATQEDVCQIKKTKYIEYIIELAEFDYEDKVETYHQIAKQMNIQLCEECCLECYALNISLPDENDENEIEFGVSELIEKLTTTPIYLLENQPFLQLKYFDNHGQGIRPKKAHEIDAGYDLKYPGKNTLVLQPKSLTKINLKITLEISPGAMIQIASRSSLASKKINIREGVIDAKYTEDITIMLQNEIDKLFRIEHAKKIAQAIYLLLINILDLQSVNNREQLGKSERRMQGFGSTG